MVFGLSSLSIAASQDSLYILIGENRFSDAGLHLYVAQEGLTLHGTVEFGSFQTLKSDIMGPFRWLANMECAHSVISMRHTLRGQLEINNDVLEFNGGIGYIEADRGRSFPTSAQNLFITQSTISNAVASLEKEVGNPIFIRGKKSLIPTQNGADVIAHAKRICESHRYITAGDKPQKPTVRIGAIGWRPVNNAFL